MEKAVIALKVKSDKSGIRTAVYQACQLAMQAWKSNIEVIDCIVTFGGSKDILREVKVIDAKERFDTVSSYRSRDQRRPGRYENSLEPL